MTNSLATYMPQEPVEVYWEYYGDMEFEEGRALAVLLLEEQIIVNGFVRRISDGSREEGVRLSVLCNDIFAWGMADDEPFTLDDIQAIYDAYAADPPWGTAVWCCIHRNEKPQAPVERDMRRDGVWSPVLEALPENRYDAAWRKHKEERERNTETQ